MSRVVTTSRYIARDSATADRPRSADQSPFRAFKASTRIKGARAMIAKRTAEIAQIKKAIKVADTPKLQKTLATRLLASVNNRNAWLTYIGEGSYRESRAVIMAN
jgi:hypothetical protein